MWVVAAGTHAHAHSSHHQQHKQQQQQTTTAPTALAASTVVIVDKPRRQQANRSDSSWAAMKAGRPRTQQTGRGGSRQAVETASRPWRQQASRGDSNQAAVTAIEQAASHILTARERTRNDADGLFAGLYPPYFDVARDAQGIHTSRILRQPGEKPSVKPEPRNQETIVSE